MGKIFFTKPRQGEEGQATGLSAIRPFAAPKPRAAPQKAVAPGSPDEAAEIGGEAAPVEPPPERVPGLSVIQRKVGFEFQTVGDGKWRFQSKKVSTDDWGGINHTKKILYQFASKKSGLSADNGDVEVVTEPLTSYEEVGATMDEIGSGMTTFGENKLNVLTGDQNTFAKTGSGHEEHRIATAKPLTARAQATIGMAPINVGNLVAQVSKMAGEEDPAGKFVASTVLTYNLDVSYAAAQAIWQAAWQSATAAGRTAAWTDSSSDSEIVGLLTIILKALWDAYGSDNKLSDPKYAFSMMHRTDFVTMLGSLDAEARAQVTALWASRDLPTAVNAVYPLDTPVFPHGYQDKDAKRQEGPTKREWMESIFNARSPKDLLSPPPGYTSHAAAKEPEGMGAMGVDQTMSLFELRGLGDGTPITLDQWKPVALKVTEMMAHVEEDGDLLPPET